MKTSMSPHTRCFFFTCTNKLDNYLSSEPETAPISLGKKCLLIYRAVEGIIINGKRKIVMAVSESQICLQSAVC